MENFNKVTNESTVLEDNYFIGNSVHYNYSK